MCVRGTQESTPCLRAFSSSQWSNLWCLLCIQLCLLNVKSAFETKNENYVKQTLRLCISTYIGCCWYRLHWIHYESNESTVSMHKAHSLSSVCSVKGKGKSIYTFASIRMVSLETVYRRLRSFINEYGPVSVAFWRCCSDANSIESWSDLRLKIDQKHSKKDKWAAGSAWIAVQILKILYFKCFHRLFLFEGSQFELSTKGHMPPVFGRLKQCGEYSLWQYSVFTFHIYRMFFCLRQIDKWDTQGWIVRWSTSTQCLLNILTTTCDWEKYVRLAGCTGSIVCSISVVVFQFFRLWPICVV